MNDIKNGYKMELNINKIKDKEEFKLFLESMVTQCENKTDILLFPKFPIKFLYLNKMNTINNEEEYENSILGKNMGKNLEKLNHTINLSKTYLENCSSLDDNFNIIYKEYKEHLNFIDTT